MPTKQERAAKAAQAKADRAAKVTKAKADRAAKAAAAKAAKDAKAAAAQAAKDQKQAVADQKVADAKAAKAAKAEADEAEKARRAARTVHVRATKRGFYNNTIQEVGREFDLVLADGEKLPKWVEVVDPKAAKAEETAAPPSGPVVPSSATVI